MKECRKQSTLVGGTLFAGALPIRRPLFFLSFYIFFRQKAFWASQNGFIVTGYFVSKKLTPFNHTVLTARNDATGKFSRHLILSKRNQLFLSLWGFCDVFEEFFLRFALLGTIFMDVT